METKVKPKKKPTAPLVLFKLGKLIKSERASRKWSLAKLSKEAFGHENYANVILKIENGQKPRVEFMTIIKILSAFEIEIM